LLSGVGTTSVYDGLTHASLGIFVTYYPKDTDCNTTVYDRWATVHALEKAPEAGYRIAVTEVACYNKLVDYDAIATAADRTFETNTLVVTAAGNEKASTFVASPGVARRVICVGGYNPQSSLAALVGSHGSTPDQRTKPEIIAPTGAMTAASSGVTKLASFGGTSGATALVGGAATLIRNRLMQAAAPLNSDVDAGQVCAVLMLSGRSLSAASGGTWSFDQTMGAGKLVLPRTDEKMYGGKILISKTSDTCSISIAVPQCAASAL